MIWDYAIGDITKGYVEENGQSVCLLCGKTFQKGKIFELDGELFDAFGAVGRHQEQEHTNTAVWLLQQEDSLTGISEVQNQILQLILLGKTDREIAVSVGIADSTVRNHRFKLREKQKQAKMFLALMQSVEHAVNQKIGTSDKGEILELHRAATMIDERYNITEQERIKTVETYMDETGLLKQFPSREKKKIIVLCEIMKNFKLNKTYSEQEINRVLKRIYETDYISIRRALIEYGFMDRTNDGTVYRVKE